MDNLYNNNNLNTMYYLFDQKDTFYNLDSLNGKRKIDETLDFFEERPIKKNCIRTNNSQLDELSNLFFKYLVPYLEYKDFIIVRNTCRSFRNKFLDYGLFLYSPAYQNIFRNIKKYNNSIQKFLKSDIQFMRTIKNHQIIIPSDVKDKSGFLNTIIDKSILESLNLIYQENNNIIISEEDYDTIIERDFIYDILCREEYFKDTTIFKQFFNLKKINFVNMKNLTIVAEMISNLSNIEEVVFTSCDITNLKLITLSNICSLKQIEFENCEGLYEKDIINSFYFRYKLRLVFRNNCSPLQDSFTDIFPKIQKEIVRKVRNKFDILHNQNIDQIREDIRYKLFKIIIKEVLNSILYYNDHYIGFRN